MPTVKRRVRRLASAAITIGVVALLVALSVLQGFAATPEDEERGAGLPDFVPMHQDTEQNAQQIVRAGQHIFRQDTFGSENFWGGQLRLHEAIKGENLGGVGPGLSPSEALAAGLKVDVEALSPEVRDALENGRVDLNDPAVTVALLQQHTVVGVKGDFDEERDLRSVGITCAFCHSTVDDSFAPGIGRRLDGWANRDLNVGAVISLAPNLQPIADHLQVDVPTVRQVVEAWGPGKFDAILLLDGKGFRPDGKTAAVLIPPAFGLQGVNLHTWTGWGSVTYWNAFVSNIEMNGLGTFFDPRLDNAEKFPAAARAGLGHIQREPDLITTKLPALHAYQMALLAPSPPEGSFDKEAAARGDELFEGKARCSACHVPPTYVEPGWPMHTPEEIGIDDFQANRSPDERYRTSPLAGLWTHTKGGFFHDGRFATLLDVVNHYDNLMDLGLTDEEKNDLVEYLMSIPSAKE